MSSADRVAVSYVKEVTPGTTPASAAFKALRITSETLKRTFQTDVSKELDENREEREQIIIGASTGGDLNHELVWDTHEDFIAAVLGRSTWTGTAPAARTIDNGNDLQHFSVLKQFKDLTDTNHLFKGLVVNSWNLTVPKKGIITGSFGLVGRGFANGTLATVVTGTPTFAAAGNSDPLNGSSNVTSVLFDDVPFTSCIDSLGLQFTNNIRPQDCVGSIDPTGFTQGRLQITGSADVYFKDETLFNKYKGGLPFQFGVSFTDNDGNVISLDAGRVKFEDVEILATGTGGDVIAKCRFRVLRDPTDGRMIRITQDQVGP